MSHLLPKSSASEFQLKEYWDEFYQSRSSAFEWYGEYLDLCHVLHKYLKPANSILVSGCGNSKLSEALYDAGYRTITNVDVSGLVIKQMTAKHQEKRPEMKFLKMDVMEMEFSDSSFDVVLDKGTLDGIYSSTDSDTEKKVLTMFDEIWRVLKVTGRYVCITLSQEHVLATLLKSFATGWLVRVHKVVLGGEAESLGGALPVWVFICTKMVQRSREFKIFEYVMDDGKCVRTEEVGKVAEYIKAAQQYAMIQYHLNKLHVGETCLKMDLWSPEDQTEPRYTLAVVDLPKRKAKNGPFAVFLVPQGREVDWMFSSDKGRLQLAESAGTERLIVVTMHRGHTYSSLEDVKEEVSAKAAELIQSGLPPGKKVSQNYSQDYYPLPDKLVYEGFF